MRYRRADIAGVTYFFTLNAADRKGQVLLDRIDCLRRSFGQVQARYPFVLDYVVVLPEHLHMLKTLPRYDANFANRIMLIKQGFFRLVPKGERIYVSRAGRGERGLWQRGYREHLIRDDADFARHVSYVHFNSVKHSWTQQATDWLHSSIHRFVKHGLLDARWATVGRVDEGELGE